MISPLQLKVINRLCELCLAILSVLPILKSTALHVVCTGAESKSLVCACYRTSQHYGCQVQVSTAVREAETRAATELSIDACVPQAVRGGLCCMSDAAFVVLTTTVADTEMYSCMMKR